MQAGRIIRPDGLLAKPGLVGLDDLVEPRRDFTVDSASPPLLGHRDAVIDLAPKHQFGDDPRLLRRAALQHWLSGRTDNAGDKQQPAAPRTTVRISAEVNR
jgi:hypothetical protein